MTYAKSLVDVIAKRGNQVRLEWSKLMRPALAVGAEEDPLVPSDIDVHSRSRQGKIESNIIANIRRELTRGCTARSTKVTSLGLCNTTVEGVRLYGQPFRCSFVSMRRIVNQFIGCDTDLEISFRSRSPSRTTNRYATNTTIDSHQEDK
jgi:hypothetical protein